MKHTIAIFLALLVIVLAIASCQPEVKLPPPPGRFVGPLGMAGVYPAWASPGGSNFIVTPTNFYLEAGESKLIEFTAADDFIWNTFYTLSNENEWIEHDFSCTVFPGSNWCTNSASADVDVGLETYYEGQNYAVAYTCTILPDNEFDCSGNRWKLIWFNITQGTEPEEPEPPVEDICSETDSGQDYFAAGTTTGMIEGQEDLAILSDDCEDNAINLTEYYCGNSTHIRQETRECIFGCGTGRCVSETCTDTDGGLDNRTRGTVALADMVAIDDCKGNMILEEAYCDMTGEVDEIKVTEQICQYGCANGICLLQSEASPPDLIVDQILARSNGRLDIVVKNIGSGVIPLDMPVSVSVQASSGGQEVTGTRLALPFTPLGVYNYQEAFISGMYIATSGLYISYNQNVTANVDWQSNITEVNENNNMKNQLAVMGSAPGN